jgi:hypothetical protein
MIFFADIRTDARHAISVARFHAAETHRLAGESPH